MAANPKIYIFMIKKGKISMISKCKHCNRFKGQNFPPASKVYQYLVCHFAQKAFHVIYAEINALYFVQNNKLILHNAF